MQAERQPTAPPETPPSPKTQLGAVGCSLQRMVSRHGLTATLYHADCLTLLPELGGVDAIVTDPPYNIGWRPRVNHQNDGWTDNEAFDPTPWLAVGKLHLFWGGNYIADKLPPSQSWHVWVKRPSDFDFSNDPRTYATIELAWSDYGTKARHKVQCWDGGKRQGVPENRTFCHPAQKPVELMAWCLPEGAKTICDPYMGSGTTGVACLRTGRNFVGIERDATHFATALERMRSEVDETLL